VATIPERISFSGARIWNTCRYQWRLSYVDRCEDRIVATGLLYGKVLHVALAAGYLAIMGNGSALDVRACALDALAIAWDENDLPWSEDYEGACEIIERQFRDDVVRAHQENGDVLAVEQYLVGTVSGMTTDGVLRSAEVSCVIDLVLARTGSSSVEIRDHKLGAPRSAGGNRQLALYGDVWDAHHPDLLTERVSLSFPTGGELDVRQLEDGWRNEARTWILTARDEIENTAEIGDWPPNPSPFNCSRCDYRHRCPAAVSAHLERADID